MKNKKIIIGIVSAVVVVIGLISLFLWVGSKKEVVYKEKVVYKNKTKTIHEIKQNENIVFLGDSITDFYPIDSIYMDLPIINSGINGYTTDNILDILDELVYQYNPTSVFILIGTNDIMYELEKKDSAIENIEKIIKDIKKNRSKTKIYFESIYPVNRSVNAKMVAVRENETIREINEELRKYCEKNDVTYIDMYQELQDANGDFDAKYTDDGLHPNNLGYARISQVRLTYIYDVDY